jgi:hypothetical protein
MELYKRNFGTAELAASFFQMKTDNRQCDSAYRYDGKRLPDHLLLSKI